MPQTKEERRKYRQRARDRILATQRAWYKAHPEKQKEYESHRSKEKRDAWHKQYKAEHKDHLLECSKVSAFKRYIKARMAVIQSLGGKCLQCGFNDFRALEVHHKDGGGSRERRNRMGTLVNDYRYYRQMLTHLHDYELLCSNCHSILNWNQKHPEVERVDKEFALVFKKNDLPIV